MPSGIFLLPKRPIALLVLAHGAGAGMKHPAMQALAEALADEKIATYRYQFPYMDRGSKRPDPPRVAALAVEKAVETAAKKYPKVPLFAGGRSFGGRMTTTAGSLGKLENVRGIVCFSFPLHPPKAPGIERAAHLKTLSIPTLWIQGTRDDLADLKLVKKVVKSHSILALHVVEGADHSYGVLKSSGRTPEEVLSEVAKACVAFVK